MGKNINLNTYFYLKTEIDTILNQTKQSLMNELYDALVADINGG